MTASQQASKCDGKQARDETTGRASARRDDGMSKRATGRRDDGTSKRTTGRASKNMTSTTAGKVGDGEQEHDGETASKNMTVKQERDDKQALSSTAQQRTGMQRAASTQMLQQQWPGMQQQASAHGKQSSLTIASTAASA